MEVAGHFKYYAQLAHGMGLGFVTETAAYDLCALCEVASARRSRRHDRLLAIFLEIDDAPRSGRCAACARRRPSWRRTTWSTARRRARRRSSTTWRTKSPERLRSIRDEMLAITSKDFWEVVDRGTNFDYVDDARKEKLREFFAQFAALAVPAAE